MTEISGAHAVELPCADNISLSQVILQTAATMTFNPSIARYVTGGSDS